MFRPGVAFQADPSEDLDSHVWIVISAPDSDGNVLCVSFSTLRGEEEDLSCVLKKGDHAFIRHDTVIKYALARAWPASGIKKAMDSGQFKTHPPLRPEILKRIQDGARVSTFLRQRFKRMIP